MRIALSAAIAFAAAAMLNACSTARDVEQSSSAGSCSGCHGFPPEQVSRTGEAHPSSSSCVTCHSATVNSDNEIIAGGAHMNGQIDATGGHEIPFVAQHTAAALANIASCRSCHGSDYNGSSAQSCTACHETMLGFADWTTNCSFCHGTRTAGLSGTPGALAAPPETVAGTGEQSQANPKVGAHQAHLTAGTYSAPLACDACHGTVPTSLAHLDGTVAIQFSELAKKGVTSPGYAGDGGSCAVFCHGSTSTSYLRGGTTPPDWTSSGGVACGDCHDVAQNGDAASGQHKRHADLGIPCGSCHPGYAVGASPAVNLDVHMNGTFEARITANDTIPFKTKNNDFSTPTSSWPASCDVCHVF